MGLTNFTPAEWRESTSWSLEFTRKDTSGFSFPCNASGELLLEQMPEAAQKNYRWALDHPEEFDVEFNRLRRSVHRYREPAHGTCSCGAEVHLVNQYQGACECESCGRWYNLFGQELLPPDRWDSDPDEGYEEPW